MPSCNSVRAAAVAIAVLFSAAFNDNAPAQPFAPGDVITHSQANWGDSASAAGQLLIANYNAVFAPSMEIELGIPGAAGFAMVFTGPSAVFGYLPAADSPGPLAGDHIDPTTTASGTFGGDVLALHLSIAFSDAGLTLGSLGVPFGDLVLTNFNTTPLFNGMTVRHFNNEMNTLLGGGSGLYSILEVDPVIDGIVRSFSFNASTPTQFAQDHLRVIPEPTTAGLAFMGLVALACRRERGVAGSVRSSILEVGSNAC